MFTKFRYKNFIACGYDCLIETLEDACRKYHYKFEGGPGKPSTLLGSKDNSYVMNIWYKKDEKLTIHIIEAVADPVTKVATYFNDTRKHFGGACLVEVIPFDTHRKAISQKLFKYVLENNNRDLWDLSYHPRFRLAILLRLRIKQNWIQFLNYQG